MPISISDALALSLGLMAQEAIDYFRTQGCNEGCFAFMLPKGNRRKKCYCRMRDGLCVGKYDKECFLIRLGRWTACNDNDAYPAAPVGCPMRAFCAAGGEAVRFVQERLKEAPHA